MKPISLICQILSVKIVAKSYIQIQNNKGVVKKKKYIYYSKLT